MITNYLIRFKPLCQNKSIQVHVRAESISLALEAAEKLCNESGEFIMPVRINETSGVSVTRLTKNSIVW